MAPDVQATLLATLAPEQRAHLLSTAVAFAYDRDRKDGIWAYIRGYLADHAAELLRDEARQTAARLREREGAA